MIIIIIISLTIKVRPGQVRSGSGQVCGFDYYYYYYYYYYSITPLAGVETTVKLKL